MDRREVDTVAPRRLLQAAPGATKPGMELRLTFETLAYRFRDWRTPWSGGKSKATAQTISVQNSAQQQMLLRRVLHADRLGRRFRLTAAPWGPPVSKTICESLESQSQFHARLGCAGSGL